MFIWVLWKSDWSIDVWRVNDKFIGLADAQVIYFLHSFILKHEHLLWANAVLRIGILFNPLAVRGTHTPLGESDE